MTAHYRQSFVAALIGHFLLILAAVLVSVLPGCRRPPPPDLSAFKDVDIRNLDSTTKLERKKPPTENVSQPPPPPAPPAPVMPADPVPPKPAPPEPRPPKPVPVAEDDGPAPRERTPPRDRPSPAPSNAAPVRATPVPVKVSNVRTTRVSAPSTGPVRAASPRLLTPGELDPLGGIKAPLGESNSVPLAERDRCLLLIRRALYDAWDRPTLSDAGRQPALLQVRFDAGGRIVESSLVQSSGSAVMDGTVRLAARNAAPVTGLSAGFLKEYARGLSVEFVVTE